LSIFDTVQTEKYEDYNDMKKASESDDGWAVRGNKLAGYFCRPQNRDVDKEAEVIVRKDCEQEDEEADEDADSELPRRNQNRV
jgi:hypothetical protein